MRGGNNIDIVSRDCATSILHEYRDTEMSFLKYMLFYMLVQILFPSISLRKLNNNLTFTQCEEWFCNMLKIMSKKHRAYNRRLNKRSTCHIYEFYTRGERRSSIFRSHTWSGSVYWWNSLLFLYITRVNICQRLSIVDIRRVEVEQWPFLGGNAFSFPLSVLQRAAFFLFLSLEIW